MEKTLDCVLCGSCVADILVRPVPLGQPIRPGELIPVDTFEMATGGIVCNAGIAMARMGMKVAAMTSVGDDDWGAVIRRRLTAEGVDTQNLAAFEGDATSSTVALVDRSGERSFIHRVGAPKRLDKAFFLERLDLLSASRFMLLGYYSLMPALEPDLAEVLETVRGLGCMTALDAAGQGGSMQPLDRLLPHLDVYVPSYDEAAHQTGLSEPRPILDKYRACGAPGMLGVKLGRRGALLSPAAGQYVDIPCVTPPGPVVDTTGAGDAFYAGLLVGLLRGMSVREAGLLGAAAGACCVTALGAAAGLRDFTATAGLAKSAP